MSKHGKKYIKAVQGVKKSVVVPVDQALQLVKERAYAKFDETVDVNINLGIDASKGEQVVRGSVVLPYGRGKKATVLVFAKGDYAEQAKKAGADYIGAEDLVEKITGGWMDFNYAVATPDLMGLVGKVAKILGPRGLLPNKKLGTVTFDVAPIVNDLKKGQLFFKNDKSGLVHFAIGKVSFDGSKLRENLTTFIKALAGAKPATSKGKFIQKITISSTMGPGIQVNPDELLYVA
jgi:large subunit ribosomal protein L1